MIQSISPKSVVNQPANHGELCARFGRSKSNSMSIRGPKLSPFGGASQR